MVLRRWRQVEGNARPAPTIPACPREQSGLWTDSFVSSASLSAHHFANCGFRSPGDTEFGRVGERNQEPKTLSFGLAFPSVPSFILRSPSSRNPPLSSSSSSSYSMAVQAQYPSNVLLLNLSEQERKSMEFSQAPTGLLDQSAVFFSNGASGNPRKRGREAAPIAMESSAQGNSINLLSLQPPPAASLSPPTVISLAQLQARPPPFVSTGLRLAFEDQHQHQFQNHSQANPLLSSSLFPVLSDDLALQLNQDRDEFDLFLRAHGEHLRRTLAEKRQRHCRALLCAAEEAAARRLREMEVEVEQAVRRAAELEERLTRLKAESLAWQAKAMADQATAVALHAQLQQAQAAAAATAAAKERVGECRDSPAEDAESAHVDPDRTPPSACRSCRAALASVVVIPCRHLCLCTDCSDAVPRCPVCRCATTGSLHVFFS